MPTNIVNSILFLLPALLSASSVTLSSSANPSVFGHPVTLSAVVTPSTAQGVVTFYDGVTVLGIEPVNSGKATFTTVLLSSGTRSLRAYYDGESNNGASSSAILTQTVNTVAANGFEPAVSYLVGAYSSNVSVGDFNGDGKPDLVIAGQSLSILLGNGDGTFQPAVTISGEAALAPVVGDFNSDGKEDLAASLGNGIVDIFLGNGDGTFQTPSEFTGLSGPGWSGPFDLAAADFNGDGKDDLAGVPGISGDDGNEVLVALENGDGTFGPPIVYSEDNMPVLSLSVGDFNGDGKPDLEAATCTDGIGCITFGVTISLGNGDGTFGPGETYPLDLAPSSVTASDLNGDGKSDIVASICCELGTSLTGAISVLLGNGDGTFQPAVDYGGLTYPDSSAIADFNGDGKLDIFVADAPPLGYVAILLGNGNGTFQPPVTYPAPSPEFMTVADFNGDGRADVAFVSPTINSAGVMFSAAFGPTTTTLTSSPNPSTYTESVTITAAISPSTATGTVTFYVSSEVVGTLTLVDGTASLTSSLLGVGANMLTASYSGDNLDAPSTSAVLIQNVGKAPTSVVLASSPNPSTFQEPITLTATVSPATASGKITFFNGNQKLGIGVVKAGVATLSLSTLPEGSNDLTASYSGDGSDLPGTSPTLDQIVRVPTATTLTSSPNPSNLNQSVTLSATVKPSAATGTVTFLHGSTVLGTGKLEKGTATLVISTLSAGSHALTASYGGAKLTGPSVSPTVVQVVR